MLAIYLQMLETEQDRATFEAIYRKYLNMMMGLSMTYVKNPADAEDAVHQAFVSIIEHFQKVSQMSGSDREAYLTIIVRNKSIDILRARSKISFFEYNDEVQHYEYPAPEAPELANKLAKLPVRYRDLLILRFYFGFTTKELARTYRTTQDTIQKQIWRGKQMLKEELNKDQD